ncbi:MAG: hypothetical protein EOS38_10285 [Mesorhizobium sp.]|nr:MAG: hypothetical protein EOS38_10285 [Mesorhizobium sp.]TKB17530.1 MAG: MFS transporter [Mesorhizobium sp.]
MSDTVRIHRDKRPFMQSREFLGFLASTLSASVGRNGYYIASAWMLVEAGHGSAGVATLLAIVSVVEFVASPLVGAAVDRFDRQRLNIAADLSRIAAVLATASALLYLDVFVTICLSAVPFAFCDRVALTSSQSMIPLVARGSDPVASNSTVFFVTQFGCLGAALLVGPLLGEHSPALMFIILAGFFVVSAASLSSLRLASAPNAVCRANSFAINFDLHLLRLFAVYALLYGGAVLVSVMGSSFVFEELKGNAVDFGHVEAAWSVGSLIGAVLLVRLTRGISAHTLHLMLLWSTALALMALIFLRGPWTLTIFAALGLLYNMGRVSIEVTLQSRASNKMLGRAKGTMHSLAVGFGLVIFGIVTILGGSVIPSMIFFSFGVMLIISVSALSIGIAQHTSGS